MKKFLIYSLTLFLILINTVSSAEKFATSEYKVSSADGFAINATLKYPKIKNKKVYSTVVLLHSLGYNSGWWGNLPQLLLNEGYAVITIDLRGHGKSVYNSKLNRVSWKSLTNNAYVKYPDDVITVLNYIKDENRRTFFDNWAFVGSDIGAGTAIIAAKNIQYKPKTIVMLSPIVKAKGLYTPVALAELNNIDILSISGTADYDGENSQEYLKKFAQSSFMTYISESKSNGMLLLKNDESVSKIITKWLDSYLK